ASTSGGRARRMSIDAWLIDEAYALASLAGVRDRGRGSGVGGRGRAGHWLWRRLRAKRADPRPPTPNPYAERRKIGWTGAMRSSSASLASGPTPPKNAPTSHAQLRR